MTPPTFSLPRPPLPAAEAQTSFSSVPRTSPTENYYATTDIIHVINPLINQPISVCLLSNTRNWVNKFQIEKEWIDWNDLMKWNWQADRSLLKPLFEGDSSNVETSSASSASPSTSSSSQKQLQQHALPTPQSFPGHFTPYVIPAASPVDGDLCLPEVTPHQIHVLEKLGDGNFGTVGPTFAFQFISESSNVITFSRFPSMIAD